MQHLPCASFRFRNHDSGTSPSPRHGIDHRWLTTAVNCAGPLGSIFCQFTQHLGNSCSSSTADEQHFGRCLGRPLNIKDALLLLTPRRAKQPSSRVRARSNPSAQSRHCHLISGARGLRGCLHRRLREDVAACQDELGRAQTELLQQVPLNVNTVCLLAGQGSHSLADLISVATGALGAAHADHERPGSQRSAYFTGLQVVSRAARADQTAPTAPRSAASLAQQAVSQLSVCALKPQAAVFGTPTDSGHSVLCCSTVPGVQLAAAASRHYRLCFLRPVYRAALHTAGCGVPPARQR